MLPIGIIPGPQEPKLHINPFLEPLVEELLKLWNAIEVVTTEETNLSVLYYCVIPQIFQQTKKWVGLLGMVH